MFSSSKTKLQTMKRTSKLSQLYNQKFDRIGESDYRTIIIYKQNTESIAQAKIQAEHTFYS